MSQNGRGVLVALAALVVVCWGIVQARAILVPFLMAAFIGAVTAPLVLWLSQRRRMPRGAAIAIGIGVAILVVVGFALLVAFALSTLGAHLPGYQERVALHVADLSAWLTTHGVEITAQDLAKRADPNVVVDMITRLFQSIAGLVSRMALVLLLVGFLLLEVVGGRAKLARIARASRQGEGDDPDSLKASQGDERNLASLRAAAGEINAYLLVKTGTSAATGLLAGLLCQGLGVDLPLVWGLLAFLLNYIPTVGSIIAAIPPTLLALLLHGWPTAALVMGGYLAINFTIGNVLEPRWMGRALGLSPLVVFLSMIVWYSLLGPVGALLSGPLTMLLRIAFEHTRDLQWVAVLLGPSGNEDSRPRPLSG